MVPALPHVRVVDLCGHSQLAGAFPSAQLTMNPDTMWSLGQWLRLSPQGLCFTGNQFCFCFPKIFESGGILEP